MRRGHKSIQNIRLIRLIIRQALLGAPSFANANICKTILDLAHILLKHACTHLQLMVGIHARRLHAMFAPGRDQNVNETEKIHKTHKKHNTDNTGIRLIRRIRKNGFLQLRSTKSPPHPISSIPIKEELTPLCQSHQSPSMPTPLCHRAVPTPPTSDTTPSSDTTTPPTSDTTPSTSIRCSVVCV
jgi:hypothetical protein